MNRKLKSLIVLVSIPILVILACRLIQGVVSIASSFLPNMQRDNWKLRTTPLNPDQLKLLCDNFTFDIASKSLCDGHPVYGPEFYPTIIETFHPQEEYSPYGVGPDPADFETVEKKLGIFKTECYYDLGDESSFRYYKCNYDLRGDGQFILGVFYKDEGNIVFRITRPMNPDG
jgi:hypothetical protein